VAAGRAANGRRDGARSAEGAERTAPSLAPTTARGGRCLTPPPRQNARQLTDPVQALPDLVPTPLDLAGQLTPELAVAAPHRRGRRNRDRCGSVGGERMDEIYTPI
jgi:hypothetical protein